MAFSQPPYSWEDFMTIHRSSLSTTFDRGVLARMAGSESIAGLSSAMDLAGRRSRRARLCLLVAALSFAALTGTRPAAAQTWNGTTSDYNTGTNWTPNSVPGSAIFSNTGTSSVNVSSPVNANS
jgi:hypothetical protein